MKTGWRKFLEFAGCLGAVMFMMCFFGGIVALLGLLAGTFVHAFCIVAGVCP